MKTRGGLFAGLLLSAVLAAPPSTSAGEAPTPPAVADAFTAALVRGDEKAVLGFLAPEVLVYESGGVENSRDEYQQHHMKADMAFLAGVKVERLNRIHAIGVEVAWVATRTRVQGTYKGKPVDILSDETLAMKHAGGSWQITHIHWSSRSAASAK